MIEAPPDKRLHLHAVNATLRTLGSNVSVRQNQAQTNVVLGTERPKLNRGSRHDGALMTGSFLLSLPEPGAQFGAFEQASAANPSGGEFR
ncbi:hypothetical protein O7A70_29910 [Mesorhizobium sp. Cs1299R1N1]|uniref:hypothetical protein n=1 Tax=Mesorhizobium sp. Cs1299R1N1 TaxID=3015172 RepID=UPI00301D50D6